MYKYHLLTFIGLLLLSSSCVDSGEEELQDVKALKFNEIWDTPSEDESGSMPLGNGDIGINVWMTPNGTLHFYIGKTDAVNENAQLLKLGKVELSISPNPFNGQGNFEQALLLEDGTVRITQKDEKGTSLAELLIWVDADHSVVQVQAETDKKTEVSVKLINWRDTTRQIQTDPNNLHTVYGVRGIGEPIYVYPDTVFSLEENQLAWAHQNQKSIWPLTFEQQNLGHLKEKYTDPLLYSTFGGLISGEGLTKISDTKLKTEIPSKRHQVQVQIKSQQNEDLKNWVENLQKEAAGVNMLSLEERYLAHRKWWRAFWNRSHLIPSGTPGAEEVAQAYILQRFITACAGRGILPVKFNGSLFNVGGTTGDFSYNADYRRWGGPYWFQNTRLIYWPMLESGDLDMIQPLFKMYLKNLGYSKERVKHYFGHEGAMFPETQYFWGAYTQDNYGWEQERIKAGLTDSIGTVVNPYIRYHYEGSLELLSIMLDYYYFTESESFALDTLLPFGNEVLTFYDQHYPRDEKGEILFYPAQAIESYWDVENPTPVVAGLRWTLNELLRLPKHLTENKNTIYWEGMLARLPEIPVVTTEGDESIILPAQDTLNSVRKNAENPELYAVYPFRIYGVGKSGLSSAVNSFYERDIKGYQGWFQDETQAAYLGLTKEAKDIIQKRAKDKNKGSRFPAFWGPNRDWTPDQDHGGNLLKALQVMMVQNVGDSIYLFPAWPKEWDVAFKLHAAKNTIIEGHLENGVLRNLQVTPKERSPYLVNKLADYKITEKNK